MNLSFPLCSSQVENIFRLRSPIIPCRPRSKKSRRSRNFGRYQNFQIQISNSNSAWHHNNIWQLDTIRNSYFIDKNLNFETLRKTIVRRNCLVPGAQDLHSTTGNYPSSRTSSQSLEFRQVLILFINNIINRNDLFYLAKDSRSKNMACLLFFRIGRINRGGGRVAPNICRISDCWQRFFSRRYTAADDPWFMSLSIFTFFFLSVLINFLSNYINPYL